jgi:hypothetical protein
LGINRFIFLSHNNLLKSDLLSYLMQVLCQTEKSREINAL